MKKFINPEDNIIFETSTHYVYKMGVGHYEIRKHVSNYTHSIVVGVIDMPDEDQDAKTRAIELCKGNLE
jgi:hypothetical protein